MSEAPATGAGKPRRVFTPRSAVPRLSAEQAQRQGHVARDAWTALGSREAVMTFLNVHHHALDGRPLDLAIDSDAGLARVRGVLATHSVSPSPIKEIP